MPPRLSALMCPLSIAALVAGCAAAPMGVPHAAVSFGDCVQLDLDAVRAAEAKRVAHEKQQNAWKAVVPFAVAARYASGKSAAAEADMRLAKLRNESSRLGCASHVY